jgi:hypothetical protein
MIFSLKKKKFFDHQNNGSNVTLFHHLVGRGGGAPICTTTRLGGLLDRSPGNSVVAYLYHTIEAWGIGGDNVGLMKSTKAPKHRSTTFEIPSANQEDRDPLLHSERTQGFAADPDYWKGEVFAYVGLPQNLKDLIKDLKDHVFDEMGLTYVGHPLISPHPPTQSLSTEVSLVGDRMLQPWDTMSLRTADLGSVCVASAIWMD